MGGDGCLCVCLGFVALDGYPDHGGVMEMNLEAMQKRILRAIETYEREQARRRQTPMWGKMKRDGVKIPLKYEDLREAQNVRFTNV